MSRRKRSSPSLDKAKQRAAALKSIDENLDLGEGLKLSDYTARLATVEAKLNKYNTDLSALDAELNNLVAEEDQLDALSERMLQGVGVKFGYDSNPYEQAGGTRKSERRRANRTVKTDSQPQ